MAIKVSAKTVAQLRKGTMAGNLAKAKNASPEMREALVRFYGAKRVNAASGTMKPPAGASSAMSMKSAPKKAPAAAVRAGLSEASKAKKYSGRPGPTPMGKTSTTGTGNTKRVNKPLVDLPKIGKNAQAKADKKAAATKTLLAEQKKKAQDKAKKNGMK